MKRSTILTTAVITLLAITLTGCFESAHTDKKHAPQWVSQYDVTWNSPGKTSADSMPTGNGRVGLNVWTEPNGDIVFYISKTDAFSENNRILKLGRVRLSIQDLTFTPPFEQKLDLKNNQIIITSGPQNAQSKTVIWVDANHDIIHVESDLARPANAKLDLEVWRTQKRKFRGCEVFSCWTLTGFNPQIAGKDYWLWPDTIENTPDNSLLWYHRNQDTVWDIGMKLQGLESVMHKFDDPLIHRTFGGTIHSKQLTKTSPTTLQTQQPQKHLHIQIPVLTEQTQTIDQWKQSLETLYTSYQKIPLNKHRKQHRDSWHNFWNQSFIIPTGTEDALAVGRGYQLQRFMNACSGKGPLAIKFNGSIFTFDPIKGEDGKYIGVFNHTDEYLDPDYRNWGGDYWWQNTRLPYWSMLKTGDFELMRPMFEMYFDMRPLARERARLWYGKEGLFLPETITFWGLHSYGDYGWNRTNMEPWQVANAYINYYWQGGLELSWMMIQYVEHTKDMQFAKDRMIPWAMDVLTFYRQRYATGPDGKLLLDPSRALETYFTATNPATDIAGLTAVTEGLLQYADLMTTEQQQFVRKLKSILPDLPTRQVDGKTIIAPAGEYSERKNMENPELYPVFPYQLHCAVNGDLALAQRTFKNRMMVATGGWFQDAINAASVALPDDAKKDLVKNFTTTLPQVRFPAFWGPNYDWIPDQDHGGVSMIALQKMLMQTRDDKILLLPAWPQDWNVDFKLHAPHDTVIEGTYQDGQLTIHSVTPASRKKDIRIFPYK